MLEANRRLLLCSVAASATLALTGCSTPTTVSADVASYGAWPAERKPTTYAFAPAAQQSNKSRRHLTDIENSARGALEKAGFTPATHPASADVVVTLASRSAAIEPLPRMRDQALWTLWRGEPLQPPYESSYSTRRDPFLGDRRHDHAVVVRLNDRASGEALYQASAVNAGATRTAPSTAQLFDAALAEFPRSNPKGRSVSLPVDQ